LIDLFILKKNELLIPFFFFKKKGRKTYQRSSHLFNKKWKNFSCRNFFFKC